MQTIAGILDRKGRATHSVAPEATVTEAVDKMCRAHIGAVLVVRGGHVLGVFTERDLMTRVVLQPRDPAGTCVGEVMSVDVVAVSSGTSVREAMTLMTRCRVRHLPVVDGGRLEGLVSLGDLVEWVIADREREIDQLSGYVTGRYPG